ncbi:hypothetical protein FKM82_005244 [Ascaphus truei]
MTTVTELILAAFPHLPVFAGTFFILLLLSYLLTMVGNIIIISLVFSIQQLHSPMYFFLSNLAFIDVCFTNNIIPTMLRGLLSGVQLISLSCCLVQFYAYLLFGAADLLLLAVMSFDRYMAICHPLHYSIHINHQVCRQIIAGVWQASRTERAWSSCSSHALVVSLIYGSCICTYVRPSQDTSMDFDKKVAILNTVVVPLLNPFIYTLRNKKVKEILKRTCKVGVELVT